MERPTPPPFGKTNTFELTRAFGEKANARDYFFSFDIA
jgi:hypothetical protein